MVEPRVSDEALGLNQEYWLRNEQWHLKKGIPQDMRGRLELDLFDARTQAASDAAEIARLKAQFAAATTVTESDIEHAAEALDRLDHRDAKGIRDLTLMMARAALLAFTATKTGASDQLAGPTFADAIACVEKHLQKAERGGWEPVAPHFRSILRALRDLQAKDDPT